MNYIKISNQGEVQPEAFTLLGASTKREDEKKIGMFGSGNKYALACFIRHGYEIKIFSGLNEILIGTQKKDFRDHSFDVITVNGMPTSITTDTGPQWNFWQAMRELYSNALDEGGAEMVLTDVAYTERVEGRTVIQISVPREKRDQVALFYLNKNNYFLDEEEPFLYRCKKYGVSIYQGTKAVIFRKGIRAVPEKETGKSLYHYDLEDISINESRLIQYEHIAQHKIWCALIECDVPMITSNVLESIQESRLFENNGYVNWDYNPVLSDAWRESLKGALVVPTSLSGWADFDKHPNIKIVPNELYKLIISQFGPEYDGLRAKAHNGVAFKYVDPSPELSDRMDHVLNWMSSVGIEVPYTVEVVEFSNPDLHGLAYKKKKILIRVQCLEKGAQWAANTIFEEYIHIRHEVDDETREMQDVLINTLLEALQRTTGKPL